MPVAVPVEPIVAMEVLLLVHVPPPTTLLKLVVAPTHTVAVPVMVPASAPVVIVTTTEVVSLSHPLSAIYLIVAVPVEIPVTIPPDTVATLGLAEFHPPSLIDVVLKVVVFPTHVVSVPEIVPASAVG
jgi:hypothetical protein